jgi:hypothetical protein
MVAGLTRQAQQDKAAAKPMVIRLRSDFPAANGQVTQPRQREADGVKVRIACKKEREAWRWMKVFGGVEVDSIS